MDNFLRAAGTFQYIHENFTNAPSMDLGPETLHMLVNCTLYTEHHTADYTLHTAHHTAHYTLHITQHSTT